MARDYSNRSGKSRGKANTSANSKRKNTPPKKRRNAPKKNTRKSSGTPGWVWMGSGLFIGLTLAAFFYIGSRPTGHPGRDTTQIEVPQPEPSKNIPTKSADAQQPKSEKTQFTFYEMLPDYEVVVPGEKPQPDTADNDNATDATDNGAASNADNDQPSTSDTQGAEHYVIQVGAFSTNEDATQRKAQVTLLGLQANVIRSELDSGKTLYRVRSDIINSNNRLTEMLKRLHEHDIDTLVLQRSE